MEQKMIEHHVAVTIDAPVHQVYNLFTHFNDFPKFMSFVKEVTYFDTQRSHWVADVAARHEWDAVNEDWIPDRQIGWRSFGGLSNAGRVVFQPTSAQQTYIDVYIDYDPPASFLGMLGEHLGVGKHFETALQTDLNHFAEMVHQAPPGALDPTSSNYLFHAESAAARGTTTERQNATMGAAFAAPAFSPPEYAGGEREVPPPPPDESLLVGKNDAIRSGTGGMAQGKDAPPAQPILDRDIINEPGNQRNPATSPPYTGDDDEAGIPPEQIPPWERPEGNQPQP